MRISDEAEITMSVAQYEENMRWAKETAWREGANWAARQVPSGIYQSNPYRSAWAGQSLSEISMRAMERSAGAGE